MLSTRREDTAWFFLNRAGYLRSRMRYFLVCFFTGEGLGDRGEQEKAAFGEFGTGKEG